MRTYLKYLPAFTVLALFVATLISLPQLDYVESNVYFYLEHLPLVYYFSLIVSIAVALLSKHKLTKLFSACVTALLIIWTPSVMLVQPWQLDSYPFVAEPIFVARTGHLGDIHYLSDNPVLGLIFGPLMLVTGISPITLLKLYPAFLALILVAFVYAIINLLKLGTQASVVGALLLSTLFWPNIFHFSRFGFSLIYYLMCWFFLALLLFRGFDRRIFALLIFSIVVFTLSHPATPLFFLLSLATVTVIAWLSRKVKPKELKLLSISLAVSSVMWLLFNMTGSNSGDAFYTLKELANKVLLSLSESQPEISGTNRIVTGHSIIYGQIIYVRLALTAVVYASSLLIPLIMYKRLKDKKLLLVLSAWALSNTLITVPIFFAGLPYFDHPTSLAIISWVPLAVIVFANHSKSKMKRLAQGFFIGVILVSSMLIPLTKYAPILMEYPPSKELASTLFRDTYGTNQTFYVYFEDPAYLYVYIVQGYERHMLSIRPWTAFIPGEGLNQTMVEGLSFWVTSRLLARDSLISQTPSWSEITDNVTAQLPATTYNKVYDSGLPESIYIPRNSTKSLP